MRLTRRTFLLGSTAATLATACGGGDNEDDSGGPVEGSTELSFLAISFPDGFRSAATLVAEVPQRLSFLVRDEIDYMRESAPQSIRIAITGEGGEIAAETLSRHDTDIITPYYPMQVTFPAPGEYQAAITSHESITPIPFLVTTVDEVAIPQPGSPLPSVATPTTADALGVDPICTRAVPCPFHDHSLDAVLGNGRPTVVLVATPGFCQTDICGPVVDLLIDATDGRDDLDVIHAEVYNDPSEFETGLFPDTTEAVNAFALPYEPALFVADGDGTLLTRLDTIWDRAELERALS